MKIQKKVAIGIACLVVVVIGIVVATRDTSIGSDKFGIKNAAQAIGLPSNRRDEELRIDVQDLVHGKLPEGMTGEKLLSVYEQRYRSMGDEALLVLETAQALGLQATPQTAQVILRLLRNAPTSIEKAQMARLYGALFHQTEESSLKDSIRKELSSLARDEKDGEVVRAAVLTYSRLGFFVDSLDLLTRAHALGFITEDDCYGDFAHLLPSAPAADQVEILSRLQRAGNAYSREVLADYLSHPANVQELSQDALGRLREMLGNAEPVFEGSPFEFGMFGAIRYERWLSAMANMADRNEGGRAGFLADRLTRSNLDPRVLLSAFMTPEYAADITPVLSPAQSTSIDHAIAAYAAKYPDEQMIQEAATTARLNLKSRK